MKNKILLTGLHGRPSTKLAFSTMNTNSLLMQRRMLGFNKKYYRIFKDRVKLTFKIENMIKYLYEFKSKTIDLKDSVVIRWGTREELETNGATVIYNKSFAINNATDKKLSRELFIKNEVNCPKLVTTNNFEANDLPIICRPFIHSKGKNFIVLKTQIDFFNHYNSNRYYYSNFIDKEREFRVHAAHGKVLSLMEKVRPEDDKIAWNRAQNDVDPFEYIKWDEIDGQKLRCVLIEALKSIDALGLNFGGVDVILKDGVAYVLEVNTAPTLNSSPYVAKRWGMYFDWLFNSEKRREHWDYLKFKEGKSIVWKNFQLKE